jgi:ABC-type nitrate/sulfonate/bicarbonate transport system substrate-binding protein
MFDQKKLTVDVKYVQGSNAIAALVSGESQVTSIGGGEILSTAVNGIDLDVLATLVPVYAYKLEVAWSIKTKDDLAGKKLAVAQARSVSDIAARAALRKLGLTPDKDVQIVPFAAAGARIAALDQHQVDATMASPADAVLLDAGGAHALLDLAALGLPASSAVIVAQRSWVTSHRQATQDVIDALVGAIAKQKADKPFTIGVLKKYLKLDDQAALEADYTYYADSVYPRYPYPKPEQFGDALATLSSDDAKFKQLDVTKLIDASFVANAEQRGM